MKLWIMGFVIILCCSSTTAYAESFVNLEWILNSPESNIDLVKAKLTLDHMIDPSSDITDTSQKLDAIANAVRAMLPAKASDADKLNALKKYLYERGAWNSNTPYTYDFNDPFGRDIHNKLLFTYLSSRKGNCVSMPLLFLIIGQKLGLDVALSTAPEHLFIKYRDESGTVINLETTDKAGVTSDASYKRQTQMSEQAISSGIYMQSLTKRETVAVMMVTLMEYYSQNSEQEKRIALADLSLKYYPNNVAAMVHKGSAYVRLLKKDYLNKYPTPAQIPVHERPRFLELQKQTNFWYDKAEALGYQRPSQSQTASYINRVNQAKSN